MRSFDKVRDPWNIHVVRFSNVLKNITLVRAIITNIDIICRNFVLLNRQINGPVCV